MAVEKPGLPRSESLPAAPASTWAGGPALDLASSPTLRRLIEEVRIEGESGGGMPLDRAHNRYDRTYSRHNR